MLNVWELSNNDLINKLAMLEVDFSKDDDINIIEYKEIKNELLKRLYFGVDYREKYEALSYAEFVTSDYYDDTLEAIAEDLHSYSDTITDGKRVAFLEW